MDKARVIDIEHVAEESDAFRKVVFTAGKAQLVVMSLAPSEEIGLETHDADQVLYVAEGDGTATIDGADQPLGEGAALCVPAGTRPELSEARSDGRRESERGPMVPRRQRGPSRACRGIGG